VTREERLEQIRPLLAEGLTHREISERLGISRSHVSHLCSPKSYATTLRLSREAKRRRTGTCVDCGGPTAYSGTPTPSERCGDCATLHYAPIYAAARRGVGPKAGAALTYLSEPRRYSELRDHLAITGAHTGVLLHRLRKYGLIERLGHGLYQRVDQKAA
jgi:hypothetical protein